MSNDPKAIVEFLNEALAAEQAALAQYLGGAKLAENLGLVRLAAEYREEVDGELSHAEQLVERILYLEGEPDLDSRLPVRTSSDPVEQFRLNQEMEQQAVARYERGIALCDEHRDPGTRRLLEALLAEEEHHVDEAHAELELLEQIGRANWLHRWSILQPTSAS